MRLPLSTSSVAMSLWVAFGGYGEGPRGGTRVASGSSCVGYVGIDTPKLPRSSVVPDGVPRSAITPPGHVSVYVDDPMLLKAAIVEFGRFPSDVGR